ncbi:hypothetical protein [Paracidovorax valerianellae]|nr:hypothetical protein [Paracidovorax valerianellae]
MLTRSFRISWYDRFPAAEHVQAGQQSMAMHLGASVGGGSVPAQSIAVMASLVNPAATSDEESAEQPKPAVNKSNRAKYVCPCEKQVWGKPGLLLICGSCRKDFEAQR